MWFMRFLRVWFQHLVQLVFKIIPAKNLVILSLTSYRRVGNEQTERCKGTDLTCDGVNVGVNVTDMMGDVNVA